MELVQSWCKVPRTKLPTVCPPVIHLPASKPTQVRIRIRTEVTGAPLRQLVHPQLQLAAVAAAAGTLDLSSGSQKSHKFGAQANMWGT